MKESSGREVPLLTRSASLGAVAFLVSGLIIVGYFATQSSVGLIYWGYGLAFVGYAGILWLGSRGLSLPYWLGLAVLVRILLLFAFPSLSDDVYRFVWDGRLWLAGYNPFDHLPSWYAESGFPVPGLTTELYAQLNSPDYFTIYPPVMQLIFGVSAWLFPHSVVGTVASMKLFLCVAELGSIGLLVRLLRHWQLPPERVLIYALNPLIVIELMGNLHFEALMIFFLLLGYWLLIRRKPDWAAGAIALSVASKLLPLMFLPFFFRRLGWRGSFRFFGILGFVTLLLWLPLFNSTFLANFGESLQLYFRRFEFNASVYYLLRAVGYQLEGYNLIEWIGPRLGVLVLLLIVGHSLWEDRPNWRSLPGACLFAIAIYLLLATTIHPWYTALPLLLCLFTPWRWPVLWTALIPLTYINYSYPEYYENLTLVVLEYSLLCGYFFWEYFRHPGTESAQGPRSTDQPRVP